MRGTEGRERKVIDGKDEETEEMYEEYDPVMKGKFGMRIVMEEGEDE